MKRRTWVAFGALVLAMLLGAFAIVRSNGTDSREAEQATMFSH
jgi:hypothetical protein